MDDKKSPLTFPTSAQPIEPPPAPPLDLSTPMPKPTSAGPTPDAASAQKLETPAQPPVEHDIASPTSLPPAQTMPAPEGNATPADSSASPQAPSAIPSMPTSSIPPMPSLDSLSAAPSPLSNPAPTTSIAPTQDSVINVSAPAANLTTPPAATELTSNVESAAPAPAAPTSPVETKPLDSTQPKKSKALVFVVIFLALVALALGSLVVWRALQPETSPIEESMTPPVVMEAEDIEEITEEEVIVEQPVEMIDGNANEDSEFNSATTGAALQGSCTQDGETYADGDEVPAPDSCNSCSCENGQIACTAMACEE